MKNLITLSLTLSILLLVSSVTSAQISVEPDDFTEGTDISNAVTGVTLSAVGSGWGGVTGPEVYAINSGTQALEPFTASTGSLVFGHSGSFPHLWMDPGTIQLRADFAVPAISVSLDFIGNNSSDFGELKAYDSGGTLIDSAFTGQLTLSSVETLTVNGSGIAYILAGGIDTSSSLGMDNMEVEITIDVDVDIKGGSCPNPFNPKGRGSMPIAIVGSVDFDVTQIDPDSIEVMVGTTSVPVLQDHWILEDSTEPPTGDIEDCYDCFDADDPANFNCDTDGDLIDDAYCGDGYMDLVVKVDNQALAEAIAAEGGAPKDDCYPLVLMGFTNDGSPIVGGDSILIIRNIAAD